MKLLLAATIADWHDLAATRFNQVCRNNLAQVLRLVADQISNNASSGAEVNWPGVSLTFKLEPTPIAKPENEAA
jgi:hypothetical protein